MSVITPSSGKFFLSARTVCGTRPLGLNASLALLSFFDAATTGNRAMAGTPSFRSFSACLSSRSVVTRSMPGMLATASARFLPSMTNTGWMRSSAVSRVSRINRREKSSRRMRRMRTRGNFPVPVAMMVRGRW